MGLTKPSIEARQPKSQATPLSEGVLQWLEQSFGGATGVGDAKPGGGTGDFALTPQQKEAGASLEDFISSRESGEAFKELAGPLVEQFGRETDRGAAQVRESMGALGNRFSSSLQREEGRFRGERQQDLGAMLSELFSREQGNLMNAIGMQQQFGQQSLNPFLQMSGLGILPEETIVGDSPANQIASVLQGIGEIVPDSF